MDIDKLLEMAKKASEFSYSPYSHLKVGAAILSQGKIFTGCNVENASYGLTMCAERVAIFKAVSEGIRKIDAIAIYSSKFSYPCGACLQVMEEFCSEDCKVIISDGKRKEIYNLRDLYPYPFSKDAL